MVQSVLSSIVVASGEVVVVVVVGGIVIVAGGIGGIGGGGGIAQLPVKNTIEKIDERTHYDDIVLPLSMAATRPPSTPTTYETSICDMRDG